MPRRAADRPAAYTRTRHLEQFLELSARAMPPRVDAEYAQNQMGLNGGDVRAFLQSLRVLGLTDTWGRPMERLRRARVRAQRACVLREALQGAYPELVERWGETGGLSRADVEGHFKLEYGLGSSSAAAAAKLFTDLWGANGARMPGEPVAEASAKGGEAASPPWEPQPKRASSVPRPNGGHSTAAWSERGPELAGDDRLRTLTELVHAMIEHDWDAERIRLVLDRVEGWLDRFSG